MARSIEVTYDGWPRGDWGVLDAFRAPEGTFKGENLVVTEGGSLTTRCGLGDVTPNSVPNGHVKLFGVWESSATTRAWFLHENRRVYQFNPSDPTSLEASAAQVAIDPDDGLLGYYMQPGYTNLATAESVSYLTIRNDKTYKVTHLPGSVSLNALPGSPGGHVIGRHLEYLVVGGSDGLLRMLRWSAQGDYNSWPANNNIYLPDWCQIAALDSDRDRLLIFCTNGSVWQLTGDFNDGDTVVLRCVEDGDRPGVSQMGARRIAPLANGATGIASDKMNHPVVFDGVQLHQNQLFEWTPRPYFHGADIAAAACGDRGDWLIADVAEGRFAFSRLGVWTRHKMQATVDLPLSYWAAGARTGYGALALFMRDGDASHHAYFFGLRLNTNNPVVPAAGDNAESGDLTSSSMFDAWCDFPAYRTPLGEVCRVRSVIVEFEPWDFKGTMDPHFKVQVTSYNDRGAKLLDAGSPQGWTGNNPDASNVQFENAPTYGGTSRGWRRVEFPVGDQAPGSAFSVHLSEVRGVVIHRVIVAADAWPTRE